MSDQATNTLDEYLAKIVAANNFERFDIGFYKANEELPARFIASCWGDGIGNHNHCSMGGETASEAITNCLSLAGKRRGAFMREPEVELAA